VNERTQELRDPLLELRGIAKHYDMGETVVRALDGVDLKIWEGEFTAILGPSGSGKSTLMHLLGFLDQASGGEMYFDGENVSGIGPNQRAMIRADKIGFVFQTFNLLPRLSVLENVILPTSYSRTAQQRVRDRARSALDRVGMADRAGHRPSQLSGGQRQRVAIARALMNEPRLILADEPTGNLDSTTARSILDLFKELNAQGGTVLIVTHDEKVARHTRRQIHVLDGRICKETTAQEDAVP
jgi:ABC-type lipoprotein export system ATPase subunit